MYPTPKSPSFAEIIAPNIVPSITIMAIATIQPLGPSELEEELLLVELLLYAVEVLRDEGFDVDIGLGEGVATVLVVELTSPSDVDTSKLLHRDFNVFLFSR